MPQTVAPPPWNGDAAVGHWSPAASDSAPSDEAPSGARTSEPALQTPAATARTVAAGVALLSGLAVSLAAVVIAVVAVGTAAALRLLFSGDTRMTFDLASSALLLAGFAVGVAATLAVPNRWVTPRPATLLLAAIVSAAWPLSGYPLPAALGAVVAVGLALAHDIRRPGGAACGQVATAVLAGSRPRSCSRTRVAETHRIDQQPARARTRGRGQPGARRRTPTPRPTPAARAGLTARLDDAGALARPPAASRAPSQHRAAPRPPGRGRRDARGRPARRDDAGRPTPRRRRRRPSHDAAPADAPSRTRRAATAAGARRRPATTRPPPRPRAHARATVRALARTPPHRAATGSRGLRPRLLRRSSTPSASRPRGRRSPPPSSEAFGDFDGWRDGYATTLSSTPSAIEVDGTTVTHVLVARDRGCPERRFRVRWRLQAAGDGWTVAALSASALDSIVCR